MSNTLFIEDKNIRMSKDNTMVFVKDLNENKLG